LKAIHNWAREMKPEELYTIIRRALEDGVSLGWPTIITIVIFAIIVTLIGSYVKTKGENLATKQDIRSMTNKYIEEIKAEYAKQLEILKHEHDLSVAALEKRLAVHQQAYVLWWELMEVSSKKDRDQVGDCVMKCQDWFVKNSLYLSAEARDAFCGAYIAASIRPDLIQERASADEIIGNFAKIHLVGSVLVEAVSLPSWGEKEYRPVGDKHI